eukprot:TRINITY_DN32249_c0_g2_i3.p1 TRINITY_DN32249_c0_g2~~TRINITY_DN32249_c0_g2_i3.p1  ORF type:complete len:490 (-),score=88.64 TRINITY_DN32249_c0_g2_i3:73-1542(-)
MDNPYVAASSATLIAFSVSFRTNIAWSRFWEACREATFMFSKWTDAYLQLMSFINATEKFNGGENEDTEFLEHCRIELTHYFSILSAVASQRLVRGDIRRMEMRRAKGMSWKDQIVMQEDLAATDLTGAGELVAMRVIDPASKKDKRNQNKRRNAMKARQQTMGFLDKYKRGMSLDFRDSWESKLSVVGKLSEKEQERLEVSKDRVALCILWISEMVMLLAPKIVAPAPILSRVFQEMSNGALGFSQAEKLSDIPFPFIFAQLLNLMLISFTLYAPITFEIVTGDTWLTPLISTITVFNFWALNEIAKELENPFGDEANNVPAVGMHEAFVERLMELMETTLPSDRSFLPQDLPQDLCQFNADDSSAGFPGLLGRPIRRPSSDSSCAPKARASMNSMPGRLSFPKDPVNVLPARSSGRADDGEAAEADAEDSEGSEEACVQNSTEDISAPRWSWAPSTQVSPEPPDDTPKELNGILPAMAVTGWPEKIS